MKLFRLAAILAMPLLLASCLLSPGKFTASLDIRKDRSFTFAYQGEVIMLDPSESMASSMAGAMGGEVSKPSESEDTANKSEDVADVAANKSAPAEPSAQTIAQRKAIAEALSKEAGYRSVEYLGGNKMRVDYLVTGKLDRNFVYPLNIDAMAIIPWMAIELRKDGTARMMAIAFGDSNQNMTGATGKPDVSAAERDGIFTFTTDATLVMQNNEAGLAAGPGTKVVWRVTPTSKAVPTAVVRFP
ncbi:MAG: hypothetical protein JWP15_3227 [Alphaproteobacteria bacterium]|nr:hypothetical protein [Alphaproteobacteria bacterium]